MAEFLFELVGRPPGPIAPLALDPPQLLMEVHLFGDRGNMLVGSSLAIDLPEFPIDHLHRLGLWTRPPPTCVAGSPLEAYCAAFRAGGERRRLIFAAARVRLVFCPLGGREGPGDRVLGEAVREDRAAVVQDQSVGLAR